MAVDRPTMRPRCTPAPQISPPCHRSNTCSPFSRSSSLQRSAAQSPASPWLACTASSPLACSVLVHTWLWLHDSTWPHRARPCGERGSPASHRGRRHRVQVRVHRHRLGRGRALSHPARPARLHRQPRLHLPHRRPRQDHLRGVLPHRPAAAQGRQGAPRYVYNVVVCMHSVNTCVQTQRSRPCWRSPPSCSTACTTSPRPPSRPPAPFPPPSQTPTPTPCTSSPSPPRSQPSRPPLRAWPGWPA